MYPILEVALAEWPEGCGPVVLGRTTDPSIVEVVRDHLAQQRRRDLARLAPPVRSLPAGTPEESGEDE